SHTAPCTVDEHPLQRLNDCREIPARAPAFIYRRYFSTYLFFQRRYTQCLNNPPSSTPSPTKPPLSRPVPCFPFSRHSQPPQTSASIPATSRSQAASSPNSPT